MKSSTIILFLLFAAVAFCQTKKELDFQGKEILVYSTADGTNQRLSLMDTIGFENGQQATENEISVFVNPVKFFQTIVGIGGAITDASAEVFSKLPLIKQKELLGAYYDKKNGIGYTLARTNINSCDFSSASYTYIEEGDKELKTFNIDHDKTFKIPVIKQAIQATGGKLTLFVSPWSPPAFMKNNNNMLRGGTLLPAYYQSWATYFTKFIKAYQKEGIPIWGLTIQNEPMASQSWESCIYTSAQERDFLKNFLGPTLKKEGLGKIKIIVWDHNRDLINDRANVIFEDALASKYAWGIGFHWYENWSGGDPMYDNIAKVQESYPDKNMIFTEGCVEKFNAEKYQLWSNGERYGKSMIHDFNNGIVAWTDWNILLDETGGPNHVGNFCFAPVHANTQTGELIYTPSYYYIGHFSKFIRPNAKRVSTSSSRSQLLSTTFVNQDGKMATVVMNASDKAIQYKLVVGTAQAKVKILPHAIQTLVY